MGRLFAIEIIYRGIYQKTLAKNISRAIVLAAHKEGKPGISFGIRLRRALRIAQSEPWIASREECRLDAGPHESRNPVCDFG